MAVDGQSIAVGVKDDEGGDAADFEALLELAGFRGAVLHGGPLHLVACHVFLLCAGVAVGADEDHFKVGLVAITELDEARGEVPAGLAPFGREVDADDFAIEVFTRDGFALCVVELVGEELVQSSLERCDQGEQQGCGEQAEGFSGCHDRVGWLG